MGKNVVLMVRSGDNPLNIIDNILEFTDWNLIFIYGIHEQDRKRYEMSGRVKNAYLFGELWNIEAPYAINYDIIDLYRNVETDFDDGLARHIFDYNIKKYAYYNGICFWHDFFSKNKVDFVIDADSSHGWPDDFPSRVAEKMNIPCFQIEGLLLGLGGVFDYNKKTFIPIINGGKEKNLENSIYYNREDVGKNIEAKRNLKKRIRRVLYSWGGELLVMFCNDIRHKNFMFKHDFAKIRGSEVSLWDIFQEYWQVKKTIKYIKKKSVSPDLKKKYVIYYIHFMPEATTHVRCRLKSQLIAIEMLSASLPDGWVLYVKEHPHQFLLNQQGVVDGFLPGFHQYKNIEYYKMINSMPNTFIIDFDFDTKTLTENAMAVATFTGTVGLEAALLKKPVIIFAGEKTVFQYCKDYFCVSSTTDCINALKKIESGWSPTYSDLEKVTKEYTFQYNEKDVIQALETIEDYLRDAKK